MNYTATVEELPEDIVCSIEMVIPNYEAYYEVIPEIGRRIKEKYPELRYSFPAYNFVVYLDSEYKESNFRVEICIGVDRYYPDFEDFKFKHIGSVPAVTVMYIGDYSNLKEAYAYIFKWIKENGYTVIGNPREVCFDGIWDRDYKADWFTEIQIPVTE